jgi:hypothetical protein
MPYPSSVVAREAIWYWGIGLAFLGGLVLVMSLVWVAACEAGSAGPCIGTPFTGRQGSLELLGFGLLIVGILLAMVGRRSMAEASPPVAPNA